MSSLRRSCVWFGVALAALAAGHATADPMDAAAIDALIPVPEIADLPPLTAKDVGPVSAPAPTAAAPCPNRIQACRFFPRPG